MPASGDIEVCYRSEYHRLVGVVAVVTGSVALAEESVQEAFARALVRSRRGRPFDHLAAWIVTVALNHARSGRRSASSERRALQRIGSSPSPSVVDRAEALMLRDAIAGLSRRQRDAVVLYYLLDMKVDAVAASLGVSQGTVKTALSRARAHLAEILHDTELEA
ncbi:MAG: RNA polymerase sigma factor [Acidimicrobiales bacterium]